MLLAAPHRSLAERTRIYAEARLGRPLTEAEQHIDLVAADRTLEEGKARLATAIAREQARYARSVAAGNLDRITVTPGIYRALVDVWMAGKEAAKKEMRSMGVKPYAEPRFYAEPERLALLSLIRQGFDTQALSQLGYLQTKVDAAGVAASFDNYAFGAVAKAMAKQPGALDAASRLISSSYASGLAFTYENNRDLFDAWQYSAVMDANSCRRCRERDGTIYYSLEEAYEDLPNFGPNPRCFGDGRCRCRLMPAPPDIADIPLQRMTYFEDRKPLPARPPKGHVRLYRGLDPERQQANVRRDVGSQYEALLGEEYAQGNWFTTNWWVARDYAIDDDHVIAVDVPEGVALEHLRTVGMGAYKPGPYGTTKYEPLDPDAGAEITPPEEYVKSAVPHPRPK